MPCSSLLHLSFAADWWCCAGSGATSPGCDNSAGRLTWRTHHKACCDWPMFEARLILFEVKAYNWSRLHIENIANIWTLQPSTLLSWVPPKQWQNNQAPNKYNFQFYIRARIMLRRQSHMKLSDIPFRFRLCFRVLGWVIKPYYIIWLHEYG